MESNSSAPTISPPSAERQGLIFLVLKQGWCRHTQKCMILVPLMTLHEHCKWKELWNKGASPPCFPTWWFPQFRPSPGSGRAASSRRSASRWSPLQKCLKIHRKSNIVPQIWFHPKILPPLPSSPSTASTSASGTSARIASVNSLVISQFGLPIAMVVRLQIMPIVTKVMRFTMMVTLLMMIDHICKRQTGV